MLWNQVYQDLRVNQQQDLLVAPGDTGGVGTSRGGIPYLTEWITEWLVSIYIYTHTHNVRTHWSLRTYGFPFITRFFMDTSDVCVSCRFTQIHPVYLNPPAMHAATPTTSNPFLLKYHFFVCWNNPVRNEAQINVWLVLILKLFTPHTSEHSRNQCVLLLCLLGLLFIFTI